MTVAIPPVPTPVPQSTDPLNFDALADALLGSLPGVVAAMNAQNVENNAINAGLPALAVAAANAAPETILSTRTITDWNAITGTGWYMANAAANAPLSSDWFIGFAVVHNGQWQTQEAWAFVANSDDSHLRYRREKNSGTWSAWVRVYDTAAEVRSVFNGEQVFTGGKKRFEHGGADAAWGNAQVEAYSPAGAPVDFSRIAFHVQDVASAPQFGYHAGFGRAGWFDSSGNPVLTWSLDGRDIQAPGDALFGGRVTAPEFRAQGGSLGYGGGSGGQVTQAVSKGTSVTLNKPSGRITTHNETLTAGNAASFTVFCSFMSAADVVVASFDFNAGTPGNYRLEVAQVNTGAFSVKLTNLSGGALSESLIINFAIIKVSST